MTFWPRRLVIRLLNSRKIDHGENKASCQTLNFFVLMEIGHPEKDYGPGKVHIVTKSICNVDIPVKGNFNTNATPTKRVLRLKSIFDQDKFSMGGKSAVQEIVYQIFAMAIIKTENECMTIKVLSRKNSNLKMSFSDYPIMRKNTGLNLVSWCNYNSLNFTAIMMFKILGYI